MAGRCARCGSYAINPHLHGREPGGDLDLCDVCYWRKRAPGAQFKLEFWENLKSGSIYVVLVCNAIPATNSRVGDPEEVVYYDGEGQVYTRETSEFKKKFRKIDSTKEE